MPTGLVLARSARSRKAAEASVVLPAIVARCSSAERASDVVNAAAGISRPSANAWPAQSGEKSPLPRCSAATRSGASGVAASGKDGASLVIGPSSRITRLTIPRAGRPVITLVMAVIES
jgi:hypothetical protein